MGVTPAQWISVKLTAPLLQLAELLSGNRNQKEQRFGAMTYGGVRGGQEAHYIGVCAEIAVAHHFDAKLDINTYQQRGDNGPDLIILGRKVEVKTTTYKNDPLLRVEIEHFQADAIYFCCVAELPVIYVCGCATADEVLSGHKRQFVNGGPMNYVLNTQQLRSFKS